MAFKRELAPARPDKATLTANMIGIGMLFSGKGNPDANIEETILLASEEGVDGHDFRVLAVLCTWLDIHSRWINADRLISLVSQHSSQRVRAFWASFAYWKNKDRRFARLRKLYKGPRVTLFDSGSDFQLKRYGEDPRFADGPIHVDAKLLRNRPADVMSVPDLAARHSTYRWRIIIGPTYRADLWAALSDQKNLSAAALARKARSSIGAAWDARRDFVGLTSYSTEPPIQH